MPRGLEGPSLSQLLTPAPAYAARRPHRPALPRRTTANMALAMGVMATAAGLGLLVGHLGRTLLGG